MQLRGLTFARLAMALVATGGNERLAANYAETRWGESGAETRILKAGFHDLMIEKANIAAGATVSGNWAELLTLADGASAEFFALVRERSLIGRITDFRRVPLLTRMISEVTGVTAAWVGEGKAKPVSSATYGADTLPPYKCAAMAVITDELARSSDPAAELVVRNSLVDAVALAVDTSFIDPANSGTAGVEPASVTNGVTADPIVGTGDDDDFRQTLSWVVRNFSGDLERAVWVARPEALVHIGLNSFGQPEQVGARGGSIGGIPAIPSKALPLDGNGAQQLVLLDPTGIALGEDAEMAIRASNQATIEMRDDPTQSSVTPTAANQVSLFQCNASAVIVEKTISWHVAAAGSVSVMTGLAGGLVS